LNTCAELVEVQIALGHPMIYVICRVEGLKTMRCEPEMMADDDARTYSPRTLRWLAAEAAAPCTGCKDATATCPCRGEAAATYTGREDVASPCRGEAVVTSTGREDVAAPCRGEAAAPADEGGSVRPRKADTPLGHIRSFLSQSDGSTGGALDARKPRGGGRRPLFRWPRAIDGN
jgi:hypothetical protein